MLKTVMALGQDRLGERGLVVTFEVPDKEFDLMTAVKAAALEYCRTRDGKGTYEYNFDNFNLVDFAVNVPNTICAKYGFSIVASPMADMVIDWDEQLVSKKDVYLKEGSISDVVAVIDEAKLRTRDSVCIGKEKDLDL